ncbi:hypothetical protein [Arthrobacter sp. efr-133-TYG-118]|uniref:hypothetical protein n=1 Tax=Arthrobacter sp. efr-133-TYG-118 TaxID=3040279 RepID=UPI00254B3FD0|nr:hypothetical protein [Arthrobacter sp. efr-133-TYG-118]
MQANQIIADFRVKCRTEMYEKLDAAVAEAYFEAVGNGTRGVLVTRHDFDWFSVALSHDVPFGLTRERDHARRN